MKLIYSLNSKQYSKLSKIVLPYDVTIIEDKEWDCFNVYVADDTPNDHIRLLCNLFYSF
jgi:hypothetical protein